MKPHDMQRLMRAYRLISEIETRHDLQFAALVRESQLSEELPSPAAPEQPASTSDFTLADLCAVVADFDYNPEGSNQYALLCGELPGGILYVAWQKFTQDATDPTRALPISAERLLSHSEHHEDGAVRAIEFCLRALDDHERGEWLRYKGVRISDPHLTVAQRIAAASNRSNA